MLAVIALAAGVLGVTTDQPCVCEATWRDSTGTCGTGTSIDQSRCPSLSELQRCDPTATHRWCQTTERTCADQSQQEKGSGVMSYCDVTSSQKRDVVKGIADGNKCMTSRINNGTTELYDISILQKTKDGNADFRDLSYRSEKHGKVDSDDQEYYINVCGGLVGFPGHSEGNPAGPVAACVCSIPPDLDLFSAFFIRLETLSMSVHPGQAFLYTRRPSNRAKTINSCLTFRHYVVRVLESEDSSERATHLPSHR
eukprot:m.248589 g.248589  ORF g.248589 m.248589 type:complete len:254 (+) comp26472_c0_seq2:2712-3473(+)